MDNEISFTLHDVPVEYWECFQKMFIQCDIFADHQVKAAVDMWFDVLLT